VKRNLKRLVLQDQLTMIQSTLASLRRRRRFETARFGAPTLVIMQGIRDAEQAHAEIVRDLECLE